MGVPLVLSVTVLPTNTLALSGSVKLATGMITRTVHVPVLPEPSRAIAVRVSVPARLPVSVQVPFLLFTPVTQSLDVCQLKKPLNVFLLSPFSS